MAIREAWVANIAPLPRGHGFFFRTGCQSRFFSGLLFDTSAIISGFPSAPRMDSGSGLFRVDLRLAHDWRTMTAQDKIDTVFLKETVADVVVKACSECAG